MQRSYPLSFGSDNHSGVHPQVMAALVEANNQSCSGYGDDPWTERAETALKEQFGQSVQSYFVPTGTGANIFALAIFLQRFESILCSRHSHLNTDEGGGPERLLGCKLIEVDSSDGKLTPELLAPYLLRCGDHHATQPRIVSITNTSEYGLVYTRDELAALGAFCEKHSLVFHIDGARLANAAAATGCTLQEITTDIGASVVSFGATKNGALCAEAVVVLTEHDRFAAHCHRKQLGQLVSKHRYIAAQFCGFLENDLWKTCAIQANSMATLISEHLQKVSGVTITRPVESNMVFLTFPKEHISKLQNVCPFYEIDPTTGECRLVTSFITTQQQVEEFSTQVRTILEAH